MQASNRNGPPASKTFYSLADIAERHDVSTKTVRRWVEMGDLIAYRFGRQLRVSVTDLEVFEKLRRGI